MILSTRQRIRQSTSIADLAHEEIRFMANMAIRELHGETLSKHDEVKSFLLEARSRIDSLIWVSVFSG